MGLTADSLAFSDIVVTGGLYITVGGCYQIVKNTLYYMVSYTFKVSKNKGGNPLLTQQTGVTLTELPQDIWTLIYNDVKLKLDPNFGTTKQSINFTDV